MRNIESRKQHGISVVIPCLNEEDNVKSMFERISTSLEKKIAFEIVFVDDGSTDSTSGKIEELAAKVTSKVVRVVKHNGNLGIHKSWIDGVEASNFNLVCLIDGDLQNPPEAIWDLYKTYLKTSCDIVQGSRSSIGRKFDGRFVMSRILNWLLNFTFKQNSYDSKSGFVLAKKEALEEILLTEKRYKYFQTFLGVAARSKGFNVTEIETYFGERFSGQSFVPGIKAYLATLGVLSDFPKAIIEFGRGKSFRIGGVLLKNNDLPNMSFKALIFYKLYWFTTPLHKWVISKNARKCFEWLKQTEFLSRQELDALVSKRWQALYLHAFSNVPYYSELLPYPSNKSMPTIEDLSKLPILSKLDVRKNLHFSMFAGNHDKSKMHKISTSGSTGEPFVCYADQFQLEMRLATTLRALQMTGWNFGDKQLRLWHQTLGMSLSQSIKEKIDALLLRRTFVPAFEFTEAKIQELLELIESKKPVLIDGYAESLNFITSGDFSKASWKPKAVMSSAQQLTSQTRKRIEENFSTRLFDKYGSREFSGIAYQCAYGTYHVQEESYIVEILVNGRKAKPGEIGEVVITDLNNFSTPMIRYAIGDLAREIEQHECLCGRNHRAIGEIVGRRQALIKCDNGVWLPGTFFAHFFKEFEYCVRQYQVVQDREGVFSIRIIPTSQFNSDNRRRIEESLGTFVGDTEIEILIVSEIPLLKTGKRTPVVSTLSNKFLPDNIQSTI
jgi:phenylacetate-CoA ligase